MNTKKCPKCGKRLQVIKLSSGKVYGHTYTWGQAMADTFKMCDYTKAIGTMKIQVVKTKSSPYRYKSPAGFTRTGYKYNQVVYFSDDIGLLKKRAFKDATMRELKEYANTLPSRKPES